jgi:uncharacterized protein DUF4175
MTDASRYDELRAFLAAVRRRWTTMVALGRVTRGSAVAALFLAAAAALDRAFHPDGLLLVTLFATAAASAALALTNALWRMPRTPSDRQVARFVEERTRATDAAVLDDSLISAVDAAERPSSSEPAFLPLILNEAIARVRALDAAHVIEPVEIRKRGLGAAAGSAALLVIMIFSLPSFQRAADTAGLKFFPGSVHVQVAPGDVRVAIGTPVRIRASVHRGVGTAMSLAPTLTVFANGQQRAVPMSVAGEAFEYVIESVDRTFSYDVRAGSARSSRYTVTMLRPPRVSRIDLHYVYPSFAGLPPRDEPDGGDIYAPAGTRVHLRVHADKAIAHGELALGKSAHVPLQRSDDRTFETDLVLAKDDSYRIRIADGDGLVSRDEAEYFIRVMDDRPPDVRILRPSADQQITPLEEVPIEARADDDYGISTFELVYAVAGGAEHVVPFERTRGTDIQKIGVRVLPAEDLGVKPGDVITYYARARDVGRGKRSTLATSDIFFLEVKPFNEEFLAAESQASGASDPQIDSLIQAQKEIIASTWNVERRSQAARSSDDVRAIAAAQAELKARAEQQLMPRGSRSRARTPAPQQVLQGPPQTRAPAGDPVATAVGAMAKAIDQLTSERTKDALPHEMIALNGLLQLQAEVRRRQVSQGSAGSGFGGNRAGMDLSALFDKELQRQQRTNYETRDAAEIKPDKPDASTSALDRIRDLAKRQEDLNRRQRELAQANLNPEEMKRQLEKLTREQTALREQTEELLRRSGSEARGSTPGRQSQSEGSQKGGSDQLRGAANEMQSAASELRRDAPGEAARSGERALGQLRRLEDQLSPPTADASSGGGSDVKLEAQQIAQEQRRIASDASRMDRNADAATAEARRRLADDKDRLASRVEEMTRKAERLAQSGTGADAKALADAAQALTRNRIADRMRSGARQMREPQGSGHGAAEQELAATLDQVAGKLAADGSAASNELEQARTIRDRLQRAEQRLRDAEARARDSSGGAGSRAGESQRAAGKGQGAGRGGTEGEVQRLRDEYQRELQRAQDALRRLEGGSAGDVGGATPEQQEFSRSAPGTQAFKQDRSDWESLRRNLDTALEKYEASVSDRLSRTDSKDRFNAGGSDRVPDTYSQLISRYFESLAKKK